MDSTRRPRKARERHWQPHWADARNSEAVSSESSASLSHHHLPQPRRHLALCRACSASLYLGPAVSGRRLGQASGCKKRFASDVDERGPIATDKAASKLSEQQSLVSVSLECCVECENRDMRTYCRNGCVRVVLLAQQTTGLSSSVDSTEGHHTTAISRDCRTRSRPPDELRASFERVQWLLISHHYAATTTPRRERGRRTCPTLRERGKSVRCYSLRFYSPVGRSLRKPQKPSKLDHLLASKTRSDLYKHACASYASS